MSKKTKSNDAAMAMDSGMEISKKTSTILSVVLAILAVLFLIPILLVLMNSFKGKLYISDAPFTFPTAKTFAGIGNFIEGVTKTGFLSAFGYSLFITVASVAAIVLFTSMTAWWITRVKGKFTNALYYLFVFAMIVPFQMVMFPMVKIANMLYLDNPVGIVLIYLGFGAGLSVFMFCGFVKSIPVSLEEAAMIDGCNPIQIFFQIIWPILKPTAITVAILNAMWVWNDYLLPYLVLGTEYKTIPIAVQYLQGGYGSIDMGAMMAVLVLAVIPIIVFYMSCQKYIIKGVAAGAVKG
ncbi:MAG: carbohydrate ABC transporter permease [Lachnospiraceae bacterium]|nr:carbohydrate ABC transporter permease [Lachnospiraceae bacterium]